MTEIQGYSDLEIIGRGGFAIVYKATQISVGRNVAIKLLVDPSPDDDLVRRFERESKAVGALSWHPHIAAVVDAGATVAGQAYIVFELLTGGSLEDRITHQPLPWTDAIASMIEVADAVEAAHRNDVLHRDIKPANILLNRLGVAKLGDFGIASMQDGNKTETGMLATTVAHAAPELFNGQLASEATDVYALGSTLFTLVTGAAPFAPGPGERIATTISRIAHEPPPVPINVPEQVSAVITHALAKQPQYRPRSAGAFGQALQQAQQELGIRVTSMPVTDAEPVAPPKPPRAVTAPPVQSPAASSPVAQPLAPNAAVPRAPAASQPLPPPSAEPPTQHVPFNPTPHPGTSETRKPFSRTIVVLSVIALALAAVLGGLILFSDGTPTIATTRSGAAITSIDALVEMAPPLDAAKAVDNDETTYWGIGQPVLGTTYVIRFAEEQSVTQVGISNGQSTELGRVASLLWATTVQELQDRGDGIIEHEIADAPGEHLVDYSAETQQIVLAISGVHADAVNAGIAEILIEVE